MHDLAKGLIVLGGVLIAAGLLLLLFGKLPFFGRLPGDIVLERKNFTLYVPITTSIILSIVVSLVLYLIGRFR